MDCDAWTCSSFIKQVSHTFERKLRWEYVILFIGAFTSLNDLENFLGFMPKGIWNVNDEWYFHSIYSSVVHVGSTLYNVRIEILKFSFFGEYYVNNKWNY